MGEDAFRLLSFNMKVQSEFPGKLWTGQQLLGWLSLEGQFFSIFQFCGIKILVNFLEIFEKLVKIYPRELNPKSPFFFSPQKTNKITSMKL
jgi:hypothetical protein